MELPFNPITKQVYQGDNILRLSLRGFKSKEFAGFNQWKELSRIVKKGEKGTPILVVFEKDKEKKATTRTVFNFEQTEELRMS